MSVPLPATATVNGTSIDITVPAEMPDGIYPIVVSDSGDTQQAYAAFVVDATAPTVSVLSGWLPSTGQISADGVFPLRVSWAAADSGSGVANALLEATTQSSPGVNDWISVSSSPGTSDTLVDGGSYWFRASATDAVGNTATSAASGPWTIGRLQEGSAIYKGAWSALPASQNWGSVRYATAAGATAKFAFNGTDVAWISSRGPNRGKAKVLIDGVLIAKVDLYGSTASVRRIALTVTGLSAGTHTLKVIVSGTSGRPRVDIDGFVVLSQPSP